MPTLIVTHRGVKRQFATRGAFGQWDEMQVEFVQQTAPGLSALHDLFPEGSGRYGLHHLVLFVDNLDEAVEHFAEQGCPEIFRASLPAMGFDGVSVDSTKEYGHFIELYEPVRALKQFRAQIKAAADNFNGRDPVRTRSLV